MAQKCSLVAPACLQFALVALGLFVCAGCAMSQSPPVLTASSSVVIPPRLYKLEREPRAIHKEVPTYPPLALADSVEGIVYVRIRLDTVGIPDSVFVFKESDEREYGLEDAALKAASKYRYTPAIQHGRPIPIWVMEVFEFKLPS